MVLDEIADHASPNASSSNSYIVWYLDDPDPIKIDLLPSF